MDGVGWIESHGLEPLGFNQWAGSNRTSQMDLAQWVESKGVETNGLRPMDWAQRVDRIVLSPKDQRIEPKRLSPMC